ncbi:family 43 glycosylhydrolase [Bifidobacterium amazonense]|uniref:Family 43 glycosylhydrolase n=1 Tax=Bifidobacterium amazonense TaxID=2809027 RepID=A0ABS9VXP2_9BIFI|nr:family 43 glycosylhydrolase [Bifidobacterium amazonense]MCH9276884.1 family 43 glycosylhydrolase [Bifidobacterium amazonense]
MSTNQASQVKSEPAESAQVVSEPTKPKPAEPVESRQIESKPTDETAYPLRMHDFSLHDPFVLADQASGLYYLYNANYYQYRDAAHGFGKSVVLYVSPDLKRFSEPVDVFDLNDVPAGAWYDDCDSPWAPEVHEWHGRYWMFVTLHAERTDAAYPSGGPQWYRSHELRHRRGVFVAVADSPRGPFTIVDPTRPATPPDAMALDGTLAIDVDGSPWMIYAHEWVDLFDGTMEAIRLAPDDLAHGIGEPVHLWSASEGIWHPADGDAPAGGWRGDFDSDLFRSTVAEGSGGYVTDGPYVARTPNGSLVSVWTSYSRGEYILSQAISRSGRVAGPWEQLEPLDYSDAGHAMVFRALDGTLLLIMHTNMTRKDTDGKPLVAHGIVYEVAVADDGFHLGRHRADLDGITDPSRDE